MRDSSRLLVTGFILSLCLFYAQAWAGATREGDGNQALKRMQFMLQQLTKEKAVLEDDKAKLEGEVKDLEKDLKSAEQEIADQGLTIERRESSIAGLNATVEKRDEKIAKREKQLRDLIAKYQDAQLLIQQLNEEKSGLQQTVAEKDRVITQMDEKNLEMFKANQELMDLYENKSGWDSIFQKEGVTGLKQVEIENILQEYRFRIEDNRTAVEQN